MQVTRLSDVEPRPRRIAIGVFDGVHLGHREVIGDAGTVLSFDPHPLAVLKPDSAPKLLTTLQAREEKLDELRVRELVIIPFDRSFAAQTPQAFIDDVLIGRLGVTEVRVGENFRFGDKGSGDVSLLQHQDGFSTRVARMVKVDGKVVSSTRIRRLVANGRMKQATQLLRTPFTIVGVVRPGGRHPETFGRPTANIVPDDALCCPDDGLYACRATLGNDSWPAVVSVSSMGRAISVRAHLVGYEGFCMDRPLRIEYLERVRNGNPAEHGAHDAEAIRAVRGGNGLNRDPEE